MDDKFQGFEIEDDDFDGITDAQWLETLPPLSKHNHEFIIKLDLDNNELGQKLGKPFNISMVTVRKAK